MNRSVYKMFVIYLFAFAFFIASRPLSDGDFWFHLKTGEYVVRTHVVPSTELFSFTNYGRPWVAHGWLAGAFFYMVYSWIGINGLIFIFALLVVLTFWIAFKRSYAHPLIACPAMLLGLYAVLPNIGVRPRVFTLLFTSIYLAILNRYSQRGQGHPIWWLVPLMTLWANLHGGFLIGFGLIVLVIAGTFLNGWVGDESIGVAWPRIRTLFLVLLASLLAALINPYGIQLYLFPLKVLSSPVFQSVIVDWMSPDFHQSEMLPVTLLILLTILVLTLSPKRPRPSELLLFLATLFAALKAQRNIAILVLVSVPLLADYSQNLLATTSLRKVLLQSSDSHPSHWSIGVSLLMLIPLIFFAAKLKRTVYVPGSQETLKVPVNAVEYLRQNQITGNTLADPNIWGGYLIWALPSNPVYIDGRDVYPQRFVKEYLDLTAGLTDWQEPFNRYAVKVVIAKPRSVLAREMKASAEWRQVFQDQMAIVFVRG